MMSEMSFMRIYFNIESSVDKNILLASKIEICCINDELLTFIFSFLEDSHLFVRRNVDSLNRICPTILLKVRDISAELKLGTFSICLVINNRTRLRS